MRGISGVIPRSARLWHLPQLARVMWAFTRATPWLPVARSYGVDLQTLGAVIKRGWVKYVGNTYNVQGFIARDGARIHALYVHPKARGEGHGTALIDAAKAESARLELWTEQINIPAQGFYRRHGFREAARSDGRGNDEGLPDIHFVWQRSDSNEETTR